MRIEIDPTGHVVVTIGFQSAGQAHETMVTQLVCEELGVEVDDVVVQRSHGLGGIYAGAPTGNRMTQMLGTSVIECAAKVRNKLREIAAFTFEVTTDEIEVDGIDYRVAGEPQRDLTLRQIAKIAYGPRLSCPPGMEPGIVELNVYAGPDIVTKRKLKTGPSSFPRIRSISMSSSRR